VSTAALPASGAREPLTRAGGPRLARRLPDS
jgi:hypothetical protein